MTALVIGKVTNVDLLVVQGADLNFDAEWWEDEGYTVPIAIASVTSHLRHLPSTDLILDIGAYAQVDAIDTNIIHVLVPAVITAGLEPLSRAEWDLKVVADGSGEERMLMKGAARIIPAVTHA